MTTVCPLGGLYIQVPLYINDYNVSLGGLYIQVPLYINDYNVSLGWSLYTGSTVLTSTTTVCPGLHDVYHVRIIYMYLYPG